MGENPLDCTSDSISVQGIQRTKQTLNSKKINNPVKKWTMKLDRKLSKEERQIDNKHFKFLLNKQINKHNKCSAFLAIREMQITTTFSPNLISVRRDITRNTNDNSSQYLPGCRNRGTPINCQWEHKLYTVEISSQVSLNTRNVSIYHMTQHCHSWTQTQRDLQPT